MNINLPALKICSSVFFGSPKSWRCAEEKIKKREAVIEKIIFNGNFVAMAKKKKYGFEILAPSTRKGVVFQLSYFDDNGIAVMHENYILDSNTSQDIVAPIHSKEELIKHFVSYDEDIHLDLIINETSH